MELPRQLGTHLYIIFKFSMKNLAHQHTNNSILIIARFVSWRSGSIFLGIWMIRKLKNSFLSGSSKDSLFSSFCLMWFDHTKGGKYRRLCCEAKEFLGQSFFFQILVDSPFCKFFEPWKMIWKFRIPSKSTSGFMVG